MSIMLYYTRFSYIKFKVGPVLEIYYLYNLAQEYVEITMFSHLHLKIQDWCPCSDLNRDALSTDSKSAD